MATTSVTRPGPAAGALAGAGSGVTTSAGTTSAPRDARARLMERPMPRPAPVTTATFPVKSNMAHSTRQSDDGVEARWVLDVRKRRVPQDFPAEAGQDRPRTHFNILVDAFRCKPTHHVFPADRRRHLPHQRLDALRRPCASPRRRRSPPPGMAGSVTVRARKLGRQPRFGGPHEGAVERRAHRQRDRALRAQCLGPRRRAGHGVRRRRQ